MPNWQTETEKRVGEGKETQMNHKDTKNTKK